MAKPRSSMVFAVLALLVQIWLGAAAPIVPALDLASGICTAEGGHAPAGAAGHGPEHGLDCTLCPACATLAHQLPLLPPSPALPLRHARPVSRTAQAGLPLLVPLRTSAAQPRAPPVLA